MPPSKPAHTLAIELPELALFVRFLCSGPRLAVILADGFVLPVRHPSDPQRPTAKIGFVRSGFPLRLTLVSPPFWQMASFD
jgi:hypothetical protein